MLGLDAWAIGGLGWFHGSENRPIDAEACWARQLALFRELGDRGGESEAVGSLGALYKSVGRFAEAREYAERQLALARAAGHRRGEIRATGNLAGVRVNREIVDACTAEGIG